MKHWNWRPTMPSVPSDLPEGVVLEYYDATYRTASAVERRRPAGAVPMPATPSTPGPTSSSRRSHTLRLQTTSWYAHARADDSSARYLGA